MIEEYIDVNGFERFVGKAYLHYADIAPTVENYLDNLMVRISKDLAGISAFEIIQVPVLLEDDIWMHPDAAINHCLHIMDRLNMDTTHIMEW